MSNNYAKISYKGFEIEAKREEALGGWENLYYYIMRESDEWFLEDSFTTGEDPADEFVDGLKDVVDDFLENPQDYEDRL